MPVRTRGSKKEKERFLEEAFPHMQSLYHSALKTSGDEALAQDLVQETFKEAWRSFHRYRPGSNCKAWLFKILFRLWGKHLRKSSSVKLVNIEQVPEGKLAVEPRLQRQLEFQEALRILESLPEDYQIVLVLADVENFSYRDISEMLEIPVGTVMSRLNRARNFLRQKLSRTLKTPSRAWS